MANRGNPYQKADGYTKRARERGFPARSVFKLEDIDHRARLLKPGMHVLDLGAAPGSWTMYAADRVGPQGRVLAIDLTPITVQLPDHARTVQGDAFEVSNDEGANVTALSERMCAAWRASTVRIDTAALTTAACLMRVAWPE